MRAGTRQRVGSAAASNAGGAAAQATARIARTAGWSGLLFAGLLVASLLLVSRVPGLGDSDAAYRSFSAGGAETLTVVGLCLVPFAGIACLWHMIATRTRMQVRRPLSWAEIPHWLHLAACLLFVCMLFAGTASVGAVALLTRFSDAPLPGPDVARRPTGDDQGDAP